MMLVSYLSRLYGSLDMLPADIRPLLVLEIIGSGAFCGLSGVDYQIGLAFTRRFLSYVRALLGVNA